MHPTNADLFAQIDQVDRKGLAVFQILRSFREESLLLAGRQACWALPRGRRIARLSDVEFKVFSQWGEDGIIEWLVSHLDLADQRFIEFGVENFQEANCRFLMLNRNWRGLVMDSSAARITAIQNDPSCWKHDLTAVQAFLTAENINSLIAGGVTGRVGLLSIDVDGNDYWIWRAIDVVSPAIVVCEYNGVFGDRRPISIPYDPNFSYHSAHFSGQYFGCSIAALRYLASQRGYTFVGTGLNGVNAFFVRNDLAERILPLIGAFPETTPRFRGCRDQNGALTFARGVDRLEPIKNLPVVDVVSGERMAIGDLAPLYSEAWQDAMS
ncbi:MAG: hypothetical protein ACXWM1_08440 [Candidatus Binataceae bacterium]